MSFINWDSHLSVGIPAMDQQHKKMAEIINQIHVGLRTNGDCHKIALLVNALIQVTQTHLDEEEQLMDRMGFPDLEQHKEGHRKITGHLVEFQRQLVSGDRPALAEASLFFRNWFTNHVQKDDRDYGVFLQNERARLRVDAAHASRTKKEESVK